MTLHTYVEAEKRHLDSKPYIGKMIDQNIIILVYMPNISHNCSGNHMLLAREFNRKLVQAQKGKRFTSVILSDRVAAKMIAMVPDLITNANPLSDFIFLSGSILRVVAKIIGNRWGPWFFDIDVQSEARVLITEDRRARYLENNEVLHKNVLRDNFLTQDEKYYKSDIVWVHCTIVTETGSISGFYDNVEAATEFRYIDNKVFDGKVSGADDEVTNRELVVILMDYQRERSMNIQKVRRKRMNIAREKTNIMQFFALQNHEYGDGDEKKQYVFLLAQCNELM